MPPSTLTPDERDTIVWAYQRADQLGRYSHEQCLAMVARIYSIPITDVRAVIDGGNPITPTHQLAQQQP